MSTVGKSIKIGRAKTLRINPETVLMVTIQSMLSRDPDIVVWRNNVGVLTDRRGIPVKYGLCVGSSDLIGISSRHGRMFALEVKMPGKSPTKEQVAFMALVRKMGGFATVVTSIEDAEKAIERCKWGYLT